MLAEDTTIIVAGKRTDPLIKNDIVAVLKCPESIYIELHQVFNFRNISHVNTLKL